MHTQEGGDVNYRQWQISAKKKEGNISLFNMDQDGT